MSEVTPSATMQCYGWICPQCRRHAGISVIRSPETCRHCGFDRIPADRQIYNLNRRRQRELLQKERVHV